ncbi:MAG TPA: PEP/pyruvate-binding domain-containing protein, partial [Nocardioidaceae bacterium]
MAVASGPVHAGLVCGLQDANARDPEVVGSKAAALATTAAQGLPVITGFAVTTHAHAQYLAEGRTFTPGLESALRAAWTEHTEQGRTPVIVRSSSTVEDVGSSSMAGRFRSVLDVRTFEDFLGAVRLVWASADEVGEGPEPSPMGVLVQRHLDPDRSGVMFGVDPVTGDRSTIAVDAVVGGPDKLVSGQVSAQHYVLSRRGRILTMDAKPLHHFRPSERPLLHAREALALARLARTAERVFGSPQDIEWALTDDGKLWLLQSRPVTATAATAPAAGPVLGPGPLAETFPDPLGELEVDLWIEPLRAGVVDAMHETSAVPADRISRSPVVTAVHGRVAADLELFGYVRTRSPLGPLDPRPAVRQMKVAWRTGALRADLPTRAEELAAEVDDWLGGLDPRRAPDTELVDLLDKAAEVLRRLHHAEALAGTLLPPATRTAAALALQVVASPDIQPTDPGLLRRHPVLLSLMPPSLRGVPEIPPTPPVPTRSKDRPETAPAEPLGPREQLRLRTRWVQELTVHAATELGRRLADRGVLEHTTDVALFRRDELRELIGATGPPDSLDERRGHDLAVAFTPPLPAQFRLSEHGEVVPAGRREIRPDFGTPAGGGRGVGPVCQGTMHRPPSPGDVLVVRALEPGLAGWLPGLAGLVAET